MPASRALLFWTSVLNWFFLKPIGSLKKWIYFSKPWGCGMCSYCRDPKSPINCRWLAVRVWPLRGEGDYSNCDPSRSSRIWTSAARRNNSHLKLCRPTTVISQVKSSQVTNHQ
jgi:hypothetical protein